MLLRQQPSQEKAMMTVGSNDNSIIKSLFKKDSHGRVLNIGLYNKLKLFSPDRPVLALQGSPRVGKTAFCEFVVSHFREHKLSGKVYSIPESYTQHKLGMKTDYKSASEVSLDFFCIALDDVDKVRDTDYYEEWVMSILLSRVSKGKLTILTFEASKSLPARLQDYLKSRAKDLVLGGKIEKTL